jgi:hypothetical protein
MKLFADMRPATPTPARVRQALVNAHVDEIAAVVGVAPRSSSAWRGAPMCSRLPIIEGRPSKPSGPWPCRQPPSSKMSHPDTGRNSADAASLNGPFCETAVTP